MNLSSFSLFACRLSFLGLIFLLLWNNKLLAADRENNHPWKGFWIAEEVGIAFDIRQHYYLSYQIDSNQCFRPNGALLPPVGPIWEERIAYADIHHKGRSFNQFFIARFSTPERIKLTRIDKLPFDCQIDGSQDWQSIVDGFFFNFEKFYAGYKVRGLDKSQLLARYRNRAIQAIENSKTESKEESLFKLLSEFIDELDDQHVFVSSIAKGWWHTSKQTSDSLSSEALVDAAQKTQILIKESQPKSKLRNYAHKAIAAGRINTSTYYIQLNRLINFAPLDNYSSRSQEELKTTLRQIGRDSRKQSKLIIDLRFNEGGSIKFANLIATELLGNTKRQIRTSGAMTYGQAT